MSQANQHSLLRMLVVCSISAMVFGSTSAVAGEIYSYTGPNYSPIQCSGTYVANCSSYHLTGSFLTTLSLNQLENLNSFAIPVSDIASFSFSDGSGLTLSQADATVSNLAITTNASGNITWWLVQFTGAGGSFATTYSCIPSTCPGGGTGGGDSSGSSTGNFGSTGFEPLGQHWTGPTFVNTAPEPSGGFLAGLGFVMLMGFSVVRRPSFRR